MPRMPYHPAAEAQRHDHLGAVGEPAGNPRGVAGAGAGAETAGAGDVRRPPARPAREPGAYSGESGEEGPGESGGPPGLRAEPAGPPVVECREAGAGPGGRAGGVPPPGAEDGQGQEGEVKEQAPPRPPGPDVGRSARSVHTFRPLPARRGPTGQIDGDFSNYAAPPRPPGPDEGVDGPSTPFFGPSPPAGARLREQRIRPMSRRPLPARRGPTLEFPGETTTRRGKSRPDG